MATSQLTRAAWLAAFSALLSCSATGFAQGQTTAQNSSGTCTADDKRPECKRPSEDLTEVVVTGSRLRRDEFQSTAPLQLITRDETVLAGLSNTTETLQSSGITSGSAQINNAFGGFVTNGGPGANTVGLRGLGPGRSLILLNGRRIAPAGTRGSVGTVDLNVLPSAIIDRVEVLRDGASSIYGSDAIAGVINVITLNKVDGLTLEGNVKSPTAGSGNQIRTSGVFGWNSDRVHLKASVDFYRRTNLTLGDRDWATCQNDYIFASDGVTRADFVDPRTGQFKCYTITGTGSNGVTINTLGTATRVGVPAVGAVGTTFNRWRPNTAVTTGLVGYEGVGGGTNSLNVRDTFDPRMLNRSLISPAEVKVGYFEGSYDLEALGNAQLYGMFLANRRESSQVGFRQLALDYPRYVAPNNTTDSRTCTAATCAPNPLIPVDLQGAQIGGTGFTTMVNGPVGVRAFIGFGNDKSSQQVDYAIGGIGLKGGLFIEGWRYDAYFGISKSDATYTFQNHLIDRLLNSAAVVVAPASTAPIFVRPFNGVNYTCAINVTNPSAGCIPAPGLTAQVIGGQLPQDWVNYTFKDVTGKTIYEESLFSLNLDGGLFDLPAGEVKMSFGAEYRKSRINDTPGIDSQNSNLYGFTSSVSTKGKDSVRELYTELEFPLLRDKPGAKDLTINVSGRYTDYDSYGADETYKGTLMYKPVEWLALRGTYGTSYRAPALFEQFLGATTGFLSTAADPCNNWDAAGVNAIRRANCQSEGLPAGFLQTSGITVFSQGGAAQGLQAETSDNFTAGIVFRPNFLPDSLGELAVSVDYYDIKISNGVARVGSTNLFNLCYNDPGFRSATGAGYCTYVQRNATNRQLTVFDSYTNVASQGAQGIDYNLRWVRNVGPGRLRANLEVQTFRSQESQTLPTAPVIDFNGTIDQPKLTGELELTYTWNKWRFRASQEYIGAMDSNYLVGNTITNSAGVVVPDPRFVFAIPSVSRYHASMQYSEDKWSVTLGMRNLSDIEPSPISFGAYNRVGNGRLYSDNDYPGRTAFMNLAVKF